MPDISYQHHQPNDNDMKPNSFPTLLITLLLFITTPCTLRAQDDVDSVAALSESVDEDTTFFYEGDVADDSLLMAQDDSLNYATEDFDMDIPLEWFDSWWGKLIGGSLGIMGILIGIIAIIFVVLLLTSPLWIFILIVWLLYRATRKDKAQTMNHSGDNYSRSPNNLKTNPSNTPDKTPSTTSQEQWTSGIKQCCLGVGLILLFESIGADGLWGIGAIILCMGISKLIISKKNKEKEEAGIYTSEQGSWSNDTVNDTPESPSSASHTSVHPSEENHGKGWDENNYNKNEN